jgi:hypothetical protein
MAETTTKPRPVVKTAVVKTSVVWTETTRQPGILPARLGGVVDRTSKLSDEVLKSLETGERSAIEALGQFVIAVQEALPQKVLATSEVAKKLTESGAADDRPSGSHTA